MQVSSPKPTPHKSAVKTVDAGAVERSPAAINAEKLTAEFLGRRDNGWTGGDATYSVALPDGRNAWFFGDSFLGGVGKDGTRTDDSSFVRKCAVLEDKGVFTTLTGARNNDALPRDRYEPFMKPAGTAKGWYWPGQGFVNGSKMFVPLAHMESDPANEWAWNHRGTDIASIDAETMKVNSIRRINSTPNEYWGAAAASDNNYTYLFASRDLPGQAKQALVARLPIDGIDAAPMTYWNGKDWTPDAAAAVPLGPQVSNQFSVLQAKDGWRLITQHGYDHGVWQYTAPSLTGPWSGPKLLGMIPQQALGRHVYNAVAHPQFSTRDELVVSYNVGGADFLKWEDSYRPRFISVPI